MGMAPLYPPGRVFWAIRNKDLRHCPNPRIWQTSEALRLFEVFDVEKVFSQIVFARDMLGYVHFFISSALLLIGVNVLTPLVGSSHMPHQYDKMIHELV